MNFSVSFKGQVIEVSCGPDSEIKTVRELNDFLFRNTGVKPQSQKLLHKAFYGKPPSDTLLQDLAIQPGTKIALMGSTEADLSMIERKNAILEERKLYKLMPAKPYPEQKTVSALSFTFHELEILREAHYLQQDRAYGLLQKLRDDRGVVALMNTYKWSVLRLIEICPIRRSAILGYNQNKGQVIALRLRTDDLKGFRHYNDIKKVLVHELTHMVHSAHDNNFWSLNRQLNKEIISRDWTKVGGHKLSNNDFFQPESSSTPTSSKRFEGGVFILGDDAAASKQVNLPGESEGITAEEKELEGACGTQH
jgi:hypothetical protein